MQPTITRQQARSIDQLAIQQYGMTGLVLMENAARGCTDFLTAQRANGPVLIACGKGNNGGDGLAMARMLDNLNIPVQVLLCAEPASLTGDALTNYRISSSCGIDIHTVGTKSQIESIVNDLQPEWIVDALLGTGASGAPRGLVEQAIIQLNASTGSKLAIDVPSGLDCDTGATPGEVFIASHTCTFVAPKPGILRPARSCVGQWHIVNIGAPRRVIESVLKHQN